MTDAVIGGAYEGNPNTMAAHVLLVPARDIHIHHLLGAVINVLLTHQQEGHRPST
jgi:hypothetical protein